MTRKTEATATTVTMSDLTPLHVGPGRVIQDSAGRDLLDCDRADGTLSPAETDQLVHELVRRYNAHEQLVALISTLIREMSPASAPAFFMKADLPRIYFHLMRAMRDLNIDVTGPGGPAVLEIPPAPEPADRGIVAKDTWAVAWEAGYKAAWNR